MQEQEYNGWRGGYCTWCVNLWLSNEEPLYLETIEMVRLVCERVTEPDDFGDVASLRRFEVAEGLKRWVTEDLAPDLGATFAADLLGYALDCVDWYELADAWLETAAEYEAVQQ